MQLFGCPKAEPQNVINRNENSPLARELEQECGMEAVTGLVEQ